MSIHYSLKNGICCTHFSNWGYKNCLCFLLFCTSAKSHFNALLCGSHLFRLVARTEVFQIFSGIFVQIA